MTAPRYETTNEDARFCVICRDLCPVDADGWCAACYADWIRETNDGERRMLPFLRVIGDTDE